MEEVLSVIDVYAKTDKVWWPGGMPCVYLCACRVCVCMRLARTLTIPCHAVAQVPIREGAALAVGFLLLTASEDEVTAVAPQGMALLAAVRLRVRGGMRSWDGHIP